MISNINAGKYGKRCNKKSNYPKYEKSKHITSKMSA
jgi:hypothetical protein